MQPNQQSTPISEEEQRIAELRKQNIILCSEAINKAKAEMQRKKLHLNDLSDPFIYNEHSKAVVDIANIILEPQNRTFAIDDDNRNELRFLLYYFNGCPLAETVFPERRYRLHKNLMLTGKAGCGKTLLMEIFSEYLRQTKNPNFFYNLSVTQMVNYYTLHNNLDRYTFNEEEGRGFNSRPVNVCLNDIGVQTTTFYGMDTKRLTNEFLHARNEIWQNFHNMAHLTTNLTVKQLKEEYKDDFNRLVDRFKTYNILPIRGESRR